MNFDLVVGEQFGIKFGNNKLLFIKTGRGGSIYGYENKYLMIANLVCEETGFSVVISANPSDYESILEEELTQLHSCMDFDEVYFVGISNGALLGAQQGFLNTQIKRMLLINGPLMINWPRTKNGIESFENGVVEMVYGTKDPSYRYYDILNCIKNENFSAKEHKGADHNFRGMDNAFYNIILNFIK